MDPMEPIRMAVALFVIYIILDIFFLGWFFIDEPVIKTIAESTSFLIPFIPAIGMRRAGELYGR